MSGLVNFAKKTFKKVREGLSRVFKSDVFKVVAIAAAGVFAGGAILGVAGASGGTLGNALSAGFSGGLAALGQVGTAVWSGVKAAHGAVKGAVAGAKKAVFGAKASAPVGESTAAWTNIGQVAQPTAAQVAAAGGQAAAGGLHPLTQAALITGGGQVLSGYARGKAEEEAAAQAENNRLSRDRYGVDGYGNDNGLYDPTQDLQQLVPQDPTLTQGMVPSLDNPPAPSVSQPRVSLATEMRDRLLASLDNPGTALRPV